MTRIPPNNSHLFSVCGRELAHVRTGPSLITLMPSGTRVVKFGPVTDDEYSCNERGVKDSSCFFLLAKSKSCFTFRQN